MVSNKNRKPLLYLRDMYCYKDDSSGQPKTKKSFGRTEAVDTTPNYKRGYPLKIGWQILPYCADYNSSFSY